MNVLQSIEKVVISMRTAKGGPYESVGADIIRPQFRYEIQVFRQSQGRSFTERPFLV